MQFAYVDGFRKVSNIDSGGLKFEGDEIEFYHQHFNRDKEDELPLIKRKVFTITFPSARTFIFLFFTYSCPTPTTTTRRASLNWTSITIFCQTLSQ